MSDEMLPSNDWNDHQRPPSTISASPALIAHLSSLGLPPATRSALTQSLIPSILQGISDIAKALRNSQQVSLAGTANSFGDDQLNVDVVAEDLVRIALARCPCVVTASSEEDPVERPVVASPSSSSSSSSTAQKEEEEEEEEAAAKEQYTIAFDPLDGSSIIAPNWTVGTIIGIWDGPSALSQSPGAKQIAAVLGVYGPRTTAIVAVRVPGAAEPSACFEVGLGDGGVRECEIVRPRVRLADVGGGVKTRYFAPANLRAAAEDPKYMALVAHYIQNKYTLRYSGGLVPDVVHALVKGHGIYLSPVTGASKAKLRRLYELCPLALVVECAGGRAVDPRDGSDVLERAVENCDERGGLVCGTAEEVELVRKMLL
ncbi:fructose-1-6-bisphosphatase [Bombardia bombarda]|uniref:Fructose-1-6-bisphosphatase n=1 Tax=Bombardia bombarda TaxID=252184 RepID=A0AA39XMN8_9PEZI|nr:fructose-1-6-bisphosphatase [Bombardia bombarda]